MQIDSDNANSNSDTPAPDHAQHSNHVAVEADGNAPAGSLPAAPTARGVTGTDSSVDCATSPVELVVSEMSQLRITEECPLSSALEQASFRNTLHELLRAAFTAGGLDLVDSTVDQINAGLEAKGSQIELGEGAALAHDASGDPETLIITFRKPGTDSPLLFEQIDLRS
ncbi:MAG TPA: hypothetical protein V6D08_18695 [Candidatus Obscuribacterales bacterium]